MERVLLTGATGFVGFHVARHLTQLGQHEVHCVVRPEHPQESERLEELTALGPLVSIHRCDVTDQAGLTALLQQLKCTGLIHCAGFYAWWSPDHSQYDGINLLGTQAVMEAARAAGVRRIVHVSTILAHGSLDGIGSADKPLTPDMPIGRPASEYARSKAAGDQLVAQLAREQALPACTCKLACCVGRDPKLTDPGKDVMRIADLISGKVPATLGHDTTFTYVDVRDAAAAIVSALHKGRPGAVYFVGSQRLSTAQYYELLERLSGTAMPKARVPVSVAAAWAAAGSFMGRRLTGRAPQAPPDLIRTVAYGTLLFDSSTSDAELGTTYRPIEEAFSEAVQYIRSSGK